MLPGAARMFPSCKKSSPEFIAGFETHSGNVWPGKISGSSCGVSIAGWKRGVVVGGIDTERSCFSEDGGSSGGGDGNCLDASAEADLFLPWDSRGSMVGKELFFLSFLFYLFLAQVVLFGFETRPMLYKNSTFVQKGWRKIVHASVQAALEFHPESHGEKSFSSLFLYLIHLPPLACFSLHFAYFLRTYRSHQAAVEDPQRTSKLRGCVV